MRSLSAKNSLVVLAGALLICVLVVIGFEYIHERSRIREHAATEVHGDPRRGEALFIQYGCGSCHSLRDVRTATGMVGPPLNGIALRTILAGHLANNPSNMERWIRDPQHVSPGTAMPGLGVGETDARDITAFLYTRTN